MNEQILDASAVEFDDYDLTGEVEDLPTEETDLENSEEVQTELNLEESNQAEQENNLEETTPNNAENDEDDFTKEVLRLKGIKDPTKIKFQDESGAIIERDWNDLSNNEKLSILTLEEDTDTDLEEEEIQFINMLRKNNLTPTQYIQNILNETIQHILDNLPNVYEIDNLNDDELYALDLIEKLGEDNITDEELLEALTQAKSNEDLYLKLVAALRTYYKNLEDSQRYLLQQAEQLQLELDYQNFSENILNEILNFEEIAGQEIELSTDDKNDIANYILTRDDSGYSAFYKDLQDPKIMTAAAFWIVKGPEIMSEMENQIKAAYQRGYSVGSSKAPKFTPVTPKTPQVVVLEPVQKETIKNIDFLSAFGLEDESYLN